MPPVISCLADTTIGCAQDSVAFDFDVSAVDDCDENPTVTSDPPSGSFFPVGSTLVTVTAMDVSGNTSTCTFTVNVEEGGGATVGNVRAVPSELWPPNHKMVNVRVKLDVEESDCPNSGEDVDASIVEVQSNEGDEDDWVITGDLTLKLRAERSGQGSGRIYSIHVVGGGGCGANARPPADPCRRAWGAAGTEPRAPQRAP